MICELHKIRRARDRKVDGLRYTASDAVHGKAGINHTHWFYCMISAGNRKKAGKNEEHQKRSQKDSKLKWHKKKDREAKSRVS